MRKRHKKKHFKKYAVQIMLLNQEIVPLGMFVAPLGGSGAVAYFFDDTEGLKKALIESYRRR